MEDKIQNEQGKKFKRVSQYVFIASLLYTIFTGFRTCQNASQEAGALKGNYKAQQGLEQSLSESNNNGNSQNGMTIDTDKTLADLLKEGMAPKDIAPYYDPNQADPKSRREPKFMDAASLLLAAKELRFEIPPQKKEPENMSASPEGVSKYMNPDSAKEKGHEFELRKAEEAKSLAFTRETSYIKPRGQLDYGAASKEKKKEKELEAVKDLKAILLLDVSGSMCAEPNNFRTYTFNSQSWEVYQPSAFALAIADYYVHQLNSPVSGFSFSSTSHATKFTKDMPTLAAHFSQLECGSTYIDYELLESIVSGTNSTLDFYVITDNDILSMDEMKRNIDALKGIVPKSSELNRVFFVEWRTDQQGYNQNKDELIKSTGLKNAYYSKITSTTDMTAWCSLLSEKIARDGK